MSISDVTDSPIAATIAVTAITFVCTKAMQHVGRIALKVLSSLKSTEMPPATKALTSETVTLLQPSLRQLIDQLEVKNNPLSPLELHEMACLVTHFFNSNPPDSLKDKMKKLLERKISIWIPNKEQSEPCKTLKQALLRKPQAIKRAFETFRDTLYEESVIAAHRQLELDGFNEIAELGKSQSYSVEKIETLRQKCVRMHSMEFTFSIVFGKAFGSKVGFGLMG